MANKGRKLGVGTRSVPKIDSVIYPLRTWVTRQVAG